MSFNEEMQSSKTGGGGGFSHVIDFSSGSTIDPILTTKTIGSIPAKSSFTS